MDIAQRVLELGLEGKRCAPIILSIGLEAGGKSNPELVDAMNGLCNGLYGLRFCGALSAGACLLSLYGPQQAAALVPQLLAWFEETYGTTSCEELKDPAACPKISENVIRFCFELLEENDLLLQD